MTSLPATAAFTRHDRPALAYRHLRGTGPTIVFLPGYMSDMAGGKAQAVLADAAARGQACLLFDYAGCGESEGRFADQTLIDWRDDLLALLDAQVPGPLLLVGSSMGGWLMLLTALALTARDGADRVAGLVGIAAAPDFTDWGFSDAQKAIIQAEGALLEATPYSDQPYVTTRALWTSGEANHVLDAPLPLTCPVRLLHGQRDDDVPFAISLRLAEALTGDDVRIILIKDGDHRLSRDADIGLLLGTITALSESFAGRGLRD